MTTPEHTLVGIHVALVCGVHKRVGWRGVALAGVASNAPDWDGLPMLVDMQRLAAVHRVWGHSVLSIALAAVILGWLQARFDWIGSCAGWLIRRLEGRRNDLPTIHPAIGMEQIGRAHV